MTTRFSRFGSAYATLVAENLSELFRMPFSVSLDTSSAAGDSPIATGPRVDSFFTLEPLRETAILSLDCNLAFSWIDRLSGGTGLGPFPVRTLTDIEVALLEYPFITFLNALHFANAVGEAIKPRLLGGLTCMDYGKGEISDKKLSYVCFSIESAGLKGSFFIELSEEALAILSGAKEFVPDIVPSSAVSEETLDPILHELDALSERICALENRIGACLPESESSHVAPPKDDSSVGKTIVKLRELDSRLLAFEIERGLKSDEREASKRAAALIILLGIEKSAEIFKLLSRDDLLSLTFEVARCESLDDDYIDTVLRDYSGLLDGRTRYIGGIDFMRETLERSIGAQAAVEAINELTRSLEVRPFDFIRSTDPDRVISALAGESSQTVAMLLSFMDSRNAAVVLAALPDDMKVAVTKKILAMGPTLPAIVRNVEKALEAKLGESKYGDCMVSGGPEAVVEILNLASRETEDTILARLDAESPEAADLIRKKMFVFEDIVLLGDQAARATFRACDPRDLVLASWSLDENVRTFIRDHLSDESAAAYISALGSGTPADFPDADAARRRIVDVIRTLEAENSITVGV